MSQRWMSDTHLKPSGTQRYKNRYSPFFFSSSPSLSLSSEEDDEDDEEDEEPEEQDDDEEEELEPECDDEDEEDEDDDEDRDEELEEDPSESDSEPRLASLRLLLLAFLGFFSDELGVSGLVRAATICLSISIETGFSSRPVGVAGAGGGLQLSTLISLHSSSSEAGSTFGTTSPGYGSLWVGGGSGEPVNVALAAWY